MTVPHGVSAHHLLSEFCYIFGFHQAYPQFLQKAIDGDFFSFSAKLCSYAGQLYRQYSPAEQSCIHRQIIPVLLSHLPESCCPVTLRGPVHHLGHLRWSLLCVLLDISEAPAITGVIPGAAGPLGARPISKPCVCLCAAHAVHAVIYDNWYPLLLAIRCTSQHKIDN